MKYIGEKYQLRVRRIILIAIDMLSVFFGYYGSMLLYDYGMINLSFVNETLPMFITLLMLSLIVFAIIFLINLFIK